MGHIHRISHTVTNDTRQPTPQITTLPHSWSAQSQPRPDPHRLFPIRSNPRPGFLAFSLRARYETHLTLAQEDEWSCFRTGNASLRKRAVWGVQSGNQGRWWQKDNRRISNHVRSVFSPLTDISTQGWLFLLSLLVSYLLEAKAQNGICPRRSFRSS